MIDDEKLRQRLTDSRAYFAGIADEHFSPQHIQLLRSAVAENRRRMREPWEHLSTGTLNAMADFDRWLSSFVAKVAKKCSVAALVPDLLGHDRERSASAWVAFAACAESAAAEPVAASALSGGEPEPAAPGAVDIVDTDYSEARLKSEWAAMLGLNRDNGLSRKIADGILRVLPGTKKAAKKVRIHIDDLPKELRGSYQRNQRAEELKRTAKGQ